MRLPTTISFLTQQRGILNTEIPDVLLKFTQTFKWFQLESPDFPSFIQQNILFYTTDIYKISSFTQ